MTDSETIRLKAKLNEVGVATFTSSTYQPGTIKHVVLFQYKESVTDAQKGEVKRRFLALKDTAKRNGVAYIEAIVTGMQNSGEGVDHGFEQGFIVTFNSEGDRNYYVGTPIITDPAYYEKTHEEFKKFVGPLLRKDPEGVLVFDFKVENK